MCQITHLGRRGESYASEWLPTIAPSPIRETLHRSFPKEMDDHDITRVVQAYGQAARRCKDGGLDGIEALAGGHLIGQFLSAKTNRRTDGFGGSLENRCRFGLMVFEEIRRRTGDNFLVGFRYVVDEADPEGLSFDDCVRAAQIFEAGGCIDFFNAIYGRMDTEVALAVHNMPGMASPIAPWLKNVGAFKREVRLPVFHAARITDLSSARYAIREGLLDMVAMTRAHIADPHIVTKLQAGHEERIRPCVGATHCQSQYRPHCLHNPATGREISIGHDIARAPRARRVVVVGGGPGGLEAARVCAERGHSVVLFEGAPRLGGQVLIGSRGSWRRDLIGLIDWRVREIERLGVDVRLNSFVEPAQVMREGAEVVIVATGGVPDLGWLDGADDCASVWDVLTGAVPLGQEVIVYDGTGRHPAPLAAEMAARQGCQVQYVSIDGQLAQELTYSERTIWKRELYRLKLPTLFDRQIRCVERRDNRLSVVFENLATGECSSLTGDQVIVEHGTVPADELFQALRGQSSNDGVTDLDALVALCPQPREAKGAGRFELYRVGDAVASRNIAAAVFNSLRLCMVL